MCFRINKKVKTAKRRKAWKVVDRTSVKGVYRSAIRSATKDYRVGRVTETDMDFSSRDGHGRSQSGIYVYTDLAHARLHCDGYLEALIEVQVSAKDFLHEGVKIEGPVATYRKVKTVRVVRTKS